MLSELLKADRELFYAALDKIIGFVLIAVIGYFTIRILNSLLKKVSEKSKMDETLKQFLYSLVKWLLWITLILILLSYTGVDIGPILASLSIIGFVTGFALKDVLSNLAAGLFILAAVPFKVGDFIKTGDLSGTVYKIQIASCVLKTPENQKITVPNARLWGEPIINYSAYPTRRIDITVGVSYDDSIDKSIKVLSKITRSHKKVLEDPAPEIFVAQLSAVTVNLTLRCWVNRADYWNILCTLNKDIKETFEREGISMPYPTMDINLKKS